MAGDNYIASIDIGTDKIALLAAEKDYDNRLRIIGHNICASDGVKKGAIFSIDHLSRVITKLIEETVPGVFFFVTRITSIFYYIILFFLFSIFCSLMWFFSF